MIRGKSKIKGDVKKNDLYNYYKENTKEELISRSLYNSFIKDLLKAFSDAIVRLGLESETPDLSQEEIIKLENKKVIYHQNDHSNGEFYEHYWDKLTNTLKYKSFYVFKPSRQYSRLIAEVVKDPNRKVFYYG